jgi:hypothetical protein
MSREPLPGNEDLAPLISMERTASPWIAVGMGVATILFVIAFIVAASRFALIFQELGIQIPRLSGWMLDPATHVAVGILMLGACTVCLWDGWRSWAIGAWIGALLLYGFFTITGLFMPLVVTIEALGTQP